MRTAAFSLAVGLGLVLAGCVGTDVPDDDVKATGDDGPAATKSASTTNVGQKSAPKASDSLAQAPKLEIGEWWKVRLTDVFTGKTHETYRVVAQHEPDHFLVGMPAEAFSNEFMVLHVPGFGQVGHADLSFEVHDALFEPAKFPLTDGKTWETLFEGRPVTATVTVVSATLAEIEFVGPNDHITIAYDATVREVVRFNKDNYGSYEVVDHGYGYEGRITVPHEHDVIFIHGRLAGVIDFSLQPAAPVETVTVDETYDRVSFAQIVGTILPNTQSPATVYRETAIAPDGSEYTTTMTAADGTGLKTQFFMHDLPGGTWEFRHVAAGPGIAFTEGIAYHVYDVLVPSGCILPSKGAHDHGTSGGCGEPGDHAGH